MTRKGDGVDVNDILDGGGDDDRVSLKSFDRSLGYMAWLQSAPSRTVPVLGLPSL
jgi:hypothetical protein